LNLRKRISLRNSSMTNILGLFKFAAKFKGFVKLSQT
jgi:hypothetical protein